MHVENDINDKKQVLERETLNNKRHRLKSIKISYYSLVMCFRQNAGRNKSYEPRIKQKLPNVYFYTECYSTMGGPCPNISTTGMFKLLKMSNVRT